MNKSLVKDDKYGRYGYLFILPFFIIMLLFTAYPLIYSLYLSVTKWDGTTIPPVFIGLDNFKRLFGDQLFFKSIANTFIIWLANVIPQMIFALGLAALLSARKIKGKGFFRAAYYLPNLVTMASVGALFYFLLDWQSGFLNFALIKLGIISADNKVNFLQIIFSTRISISFILWWMWFGYSMIIFMAGIKAIPEELYEAARVDGAGGWKAFRHITIPCLRPTLLYNIVTSIIGGMTIFDVPMVLTGGTGAPQDSAVTMVMYLYNQAFQSQNYGYGATVGVGLFLMIVIFVAIAFRFLNRNTERLEGE